MHEVIIKRLKCAECGKAFKDQVKPIYYILMLFDLLYV